MWQGLHSVLAFTIRYRENPTGRAATEPRLSVVDGLATLEASRISGSPSMLKARGEIDTRNPFIPSFSPVCRVADLVMMFGTAAAGLVAAAACLFRVL